MMGKLFDAPLHEAHAVLSDNPLPEQLSPQEDHDSGALVGAVRATILRIIASGRRPGPGELLTELEGELGWRSRLLVAETIGALRTDESLRSPVRQYITTVLTGPAVAEALRGEVPRDREFRSVVDDLLRRGALYRRSAAFREMLRFTAKFRDYSPYNNMLVRVQNPSCAYYATERDWMRRFGCELKTDARPMIILAPMQPVMLVFDLDSVEKPPIPEHLERWTAASGAWDARWIQRTVANAAREGIAVEFKTLSRSRAGFATDARATSGFKMRIVVHDRLVPQERYAVLCHELAHIYLGHLGTDAESPWPCRTNLSLDTVEIEAESVAYIVTARLGLVTESERYLARFAKVPGVPETVSVELISKVAGRLEEMATRTLQPRVRKPKAKLPAGS